MINDKFKKIYKLSEQLHQKYLKQDYERLLKIDDSIGAFEDYVKDNNRDDDNALSEERKKRVEESYISRDNIENDDITFGLYLFRYNHIDPIKFDDNYKPLPLTEKEIFEYGTVVTLTDEEGYYNISGVFGGIDYDKNNAIKEYNILKNHIKNSSTEEILDEIEKSILDQLND